MSSTLPSTVDCLLQPDFQKPELIRTRIRLQLPVLEKDEHLLRISCVAPCAHELLWGPAFPGTFAPNKINVPCFDYSGTVMLAPKDSPFQPGSKVFGAGNFSNTGCAQEYAIARSSEMALKPESLSWAAAASMPISAMTAYQALFEHGGLACGWKSGVEKAKNAGKALLVTAAAGGVGVWAVQLARAAGVTSIIAVCGPDNVDLVKALGATAVIDYRQRGIGDCYRPGGYDKVDLVLDMIGGPTLAECWAAVKDGGQLISVHEPPEGHRPRDKQTTRGSWFIFDPNGLQLAEIASLVGSGQAETLVDSEWGMEQYQDAFARVDTGHSRGKVIISLSS